MIYYIYTLKVVILKHIFKCFKLFVIIALMFSVTKVNVEKDNKIVYNDNSNKVLDLTAMAIKMEEIRMNDYIKICIFQIRAFREIKFFLLFTAYERLDCRLGYTNIFE